MLYGIAVTSRSWLLLLLLLLLGMAWSLKLHLILHFFQVVHSWHIGRHRSAHLHEVLVLHWVVTLAGTSMNMGALVACLSRSTTEHLNASTARVVWAAVATVGSVDVQMA